METIAKMRNAKNKAHQKRTGLTYLLVTDEAVVLLPKGDTAIRPADSKRMDHWMPLQLRNLILATSDLEVWNEGTLIGHEDDAGRIGGDGEHDVDLAVGPGGELTLLVILHLDEVVEEHCHLAIMVFIFIITVLLVGFLAMVSRKMLLVS